MGLFDALSSAFDTVSNFVGGGGGSVLGDALNAGATIAGNVISSNANADAAKKAQAALDARTAAIQEGNANAQQRYQQIIDRTQPGVNALTQIVARNPYELTPEQQQAQADLRRNTTTALGASGLRGSGRAMLKALRGTESDFTNKAVTTNLNQQDQAARQLSGENVNATNAAAGLDTATGAATGAGALASGTTGANADLANATLRGSAIGDIASIIAGEQKAKGRSSKYSTDNQSQDAAP